MQARLNRLTEGFSPKSTCLSAFTITLPACFVIPCWTGPSTWLRPGGECQSTSNPSKIPSKDSSLTVHFAVLSSSAPDTSILSTALAKKAYPSLTLQLRAHHLGEDCQIPASSRRPSQTTARRLRSLRHPSCHPKAIGAARPTLSSIKVFSRLSYLAFSG